jgi:hypothetical protein
LLVANYQYNDRCYQKLVVLNNATGSTSYADVDLALAIPATAKIVFGRTGASGNMGDHSFIVVCSNDDVLVFGSTQINEYPRTYPIEQASFELPILLSQKIRWKTYDTKSAYWLCVDGYIDDI